MSKLLTLAVSALFAHDADGKIDEEKSVSNFRAHVAKTKTEQELEESTIARAVSAVFDENPGASINMDGVIGMALRGLNVQQANYTAMQDKVGAYIRANSDRAEKKDRKTGKVTQQKEQPRTRLFGIKKGLGGGVCRWSDVPLAGDSAPESAE